MHCTVVVISSFLSKCHTREEGNGVVDTVIIYLGSARNGESSESEELCL